MSDVPVFDFPRLCGALHEGWRSLLVQHENTGALLTHVANLVAALDQTKGYAPEALQEHLESALQDTSSFVLKYCENHGAVSQIHESLREVFRTLIEGMETASKIQEAQEKSGFGNA